MGGVRKQVTNDGTFFKGFLDFKKRFARYPAISYGFVPRFAAFALTHDHVETVITHVEALAGALHTLSLIHI